jgi:hypothetical protein
MLTLEWPGSGQSQLLSSHHGAGSLGVPAKKDIKDVPLLSLRRKYNFLNHQRNSILFSIWEFLSGR